MTIWLSVRHFRWTARPVKLSRLQLWCRRLLHGSFPAIGTGTLMTRRIALIVAAGRGTRFGTVLPKQYADLAGIPVIRRTILVFLQHGGRAGVRCVFTPDDGEAYTAAAAGLVLLPPVNGDAPR